MTPIRVQRKRAKGWKMPEGAIYVGRPSKWGNPYSIEKLTAHLAQFDRTSDENSLRKLSVEMFETDLTYGPDSRYWWFGPHMQIIEIKHALQNGELRGHNLVCWCAPDEPCHADVLLKLANKEVTL